MFALWYFLMRLFFCPDIHPNPGPINSGRHSQHHLFNFMTWNLNSLAKDNFQCVSLIEAQNSIFNYDLISICETSLNDAVELPEPLLTILQTGGGIGLFL